MEAVAHNFAVPHFGDIPLACVIPSKTNPRKNFDGVALEELASSIKQHGIAQPILVRPMADEYVELDGTQVACVEIVAGERRYRAAKMAGLETVPAIVRALSDVQALELQILENLQRKDVHEIEEAEGYDRLMKEAGYTADQLAEKVGKSRSYIYGRLKLCALAPAARDACFDGRINASTALLIARIPVAELQAKAAEEIVKPTHGNEPLSYRQAEHIIRHRYMLDLDEAPFNIEDGKLVKAAGACGTCPKRTGSNPLLYADVDPNVCTDPDCFEQKKVVHFDRVVAKAEKKGLPVLRSDDADRFKKMQEAGLLGPDTLLHNFDRRAPNQHTGYRSVGLLLDEEQLPEPAGYLRHEGELTPLYTKTAMQEALEAAGICETAEQYDARMAAEEAEHNGGGEDNDEQASGSTRHTAKPGKSDDQVKAEELTAQRVRIYEAIRAKLLETQDTTTALRRAASFIVREWQHPSELKHLYSFNTFNDADCIDFFNEASAADIAVFLLEIALGPDALTVSQWNVQRDEIESDDYLDMLDLAKSVGVDLTALEPATEEAEPEAPADPEPPKKTRGKKAKKADDAETNTADNWPFPTRARP